MVMALVHWYKWPLCEIEKLYMDEMDYKGLIYLYKDVLKQYEKAKGKK